MKKISLIVTAYFEQNKKYLDLCMESIANLDYPKKLIETILVAPSRYQPQYENVKTIAPPQSEFHWPIGPNFGINQASQDAEFYMVLNDDVILTRDSMKAIVGHASDDAIYGPISNCDNGWQYNIALGYQIDNTNYMVQDRFFKLEDLKQEHVTHFKNAKSFYPPALIHSRSNWIAFYATLIPKKVWNIVGLFDEKFKTGQDDLDYCLRCKQNGIGVFINMNALIWHFGGRSADISLNDNIRKENISYFEEKWGAHPKVFA